MLDRIFTRIGATDFLSVGQSTFMVEMLETASILHNATPRSLILLDEIGRGTSTFDGLSIAWAVAEYLHESERVRAKTLFATHYHELTELALTLPRIKNYHVAVKEREGRGRLPAEHRARPLRPELRHPCGQAGRHSARRSSAGPGRSSSTWRKRSWTRPVAAAGLSPKAGPARTSARCCLFGEDRETSALEEVGEALQGLRLSAA